MQLINIILPKLGESVAEATIIKWLKQVGDTIEKDENIAEVATDKVDTDLPAAHAGILKSIVIQEGQNVAVGAVIATMEVRDADAIESELAMQTDSPVNQPSSTPSMAGVTAPQRLEGRTLAAKAGMLLTPVVRRIAAAAGLSAEDLLQIPATGSNNTRITKKDILNYLHTPSSAPQDVGYDPKRNLPIEGGDTVTQMSRMRKLIAEHMSRSVNTAAHVTSWVLVDVTDIVALRDRSKAAFYLKYETKLTYTHLFMQHIIAVLAEYPKLNAWLNGGDELIIKKRINLGFAAATPDDNLIVPNLKDAGSLDLIQIAKEVNRLGTAAKNNRLKPSDIADTTFTVSNTGIFGSLMGTPILALPQVGILALGAIERQPAVVTIEGIEKIVVRSQMYLSLSYDHRIIDGAYASRYLSALKKRIESVNYIPNFLFDLA